MKFAKRLKDLREDRDLTQAQLAKEIDLDQRSISFYEIGKYEPSLETLIKIANFFEVSTDYMLGLTNNPEQRAKETKEQSYIKQQFNVNGNMNNNKFM